MSKIKLKNNRVNLKIKLIIIIFLTLIFMHYIIDFITKKISNNLLSISNKILYSENMSELNYALLTCEKNIKDYNSIIEINKNKKGEIIDINFDIEKCEEILLNTISQIENDNNFNLIKGKNFFIPFGYTTNLPLLFNLGPKIPINVKMANTVTGNIKTKIKDYGINNALVEIYMEVSINLNLIMPNNIKNKILKQDVLLSSKIIVGKVPSFYNGQFNKESRNINLPIK